MRRKAYHSSDAEEIHTLVQNIKHGSGDQKPHGNRYGSHTSTGERVLVHRGGGKPGRNVEKTTERSSSDIVKNGFHHGETLPNSFLANATKETFDGLASANPTFKFSVEGKTYFAKSMEGVETRSPYTEEESYKNELRGPAIMEALGLKDMISPVASTEYNGNRYLIQEWQSGAQSALSPQGKELIANLSDEEVSRSLAAEYLTGDHDRHGGNIMIVDGQIKEIDFGNPIEDDTKFSNTKMRMFIYNTTGASQRKVSKSTVEDLLSKSKEAIAAADTYPTKNSSVNIRTRFTLLSNALKSKKNPSWGDVSRFINKGSKGA